MQVSVTFRHLEATEALKQYAEEKVEHLSKFFKRNVEAHVVLYLERFLHVADVTVHAGNVRLKGLAKTDGMYASIDEAMGKIERQLLKYKEKIKAHKAEGTRGRIATFGRSPIDAGEVIDLLDEAEQARVAAKANGNVRRRRTAPRRETPVRAN